MTVGGWVSLLTFHLEQITEKNLTILALNFASWIRKEILPLEKGVGCQASLCSEQVTTTVFLRTRRDGSHSIIINLKSLDKIIEKLVSWLIGALNPLNR